MPDSLTLSQIIGGIIGSLGLGGVFVKWLETRGELAKSGEDELAKFRAELREEIAGLKREHKTEVQSFDDRDRARGQEIELLKMQNRAFRGELADVRRVFAGYRAMVKTMIWKAEQDDPEWRKLAAILKRDGDADLFDVSFGTSDVPDTETPALTQKRVLVVDDYADARTMLVTHLKNLGYAGEGAASGVLALELLERAAATNRPFDLVLLDHAMPNLTGAEVAAMLPTMGHHAKIVFVTGHGEEVRSTWKDVGAHALWTKPLPFDKLADMLSGVLKTD